MAAIIEPQGPPEEGAPRGSLGRRLAWFAALAIASAGATALIAYALKALLPAG
jgi:hypothetical protein